jgi:hypothetical protein
MDSPQVIRPRLQTRNMIYTDAQNLDIRSREFGQVGLIRRDLTRSYRGPGHRVKGQNDRFTLQVTQADRFAQVAWKRKIGSWLSNA